MRAGRSGPRQLTPADRILVALIIGGFWAWFAWHNANPGPGFRADFDQVWYAARVLLQGGDPYLSIGPGKPFESEWPFYYPLSAAVAVAPLAVLPLPVARVVFGALPIAILVYIVAGLDVKKLVIFASRPVYLNALMGQWAAWLTCALFLPVAGWFLLGKPNLGLAMLGGMRRWRGALLALGIGAIPVAVSFALQPGWFREWLGVLGSAHHFQAYALLPGGQLLLLAALRWRRWEGRLLLLLALVPQTPGPLSALPLLLVPPTAAGTFILSALTYVPSIIAPHFAAEATYESLMRSVALVTLVAVYLPVLVIVMRLRNEGAVPGWLEKRIAAWPSWIRGYPAGVPSAA